MTTVLFAGGAEYWPDYETALPEALSEAGITAKVVTEAEPDNVDYIVYAPSSPLQDFSPFTSLKAVLNLWAGVEGVTKNATLTVPLARMVDPGMTEGMVEYCLGHVLRYHLGMDADIKRDDREWVYHSPPLARDRRVTVLGLGELGAAVAEALAALRFDVAGWSRSPKTLQGVSCHSGEDGLGKALSHGEICVTLLPLTPATENLLNAGRFAEMPMGAMLINPGRGGLIEDDALLVALNEGRIAAATLDAFRVEPLPKEHPFWGDPRVTITPHVASATRPKTASQTLAENIRRGEAGEPFLHLVDRAAGY